MEANKHSNSKILHLAAGFLFGIIVLASLFYIAAVLNRPQKGTSNSATLTTFGLDLTSAPSDGAAVSSKIVTISGTTGTDSVVLVNGGSDDASVETNNGKFSLSYTLNEGENQITVTAFDTKTGASKTTTRNILYLPDLNTL